MHDEKVDSIDVELILDRDKYSQDEIAVFIEDNNNPIYISDDDNFKHIQKEDIYFININIHKFKIKSIKKPNLDIVEKKQQIQYLLSTEKINSFSSSSSGIFGYGLDLI